MLITGEVNCSVDPECCGEPEPDPPKTNPAPAGESPAIADPAFTFLSTISDQEVPFHFSVTAPPTVTAFELSSPKDTHPQSPVFISATSVHDVPFHDSQTVKAVDGGPRPPPVIAEVYVPDIGK